MDCNSIFFWTIVGILGNISTIVIFYLYERHMKKTIDRLVKQVLEKKKRRGAFP